MTLWAPGVFNPVFVGSMSPVRAATERVSNCQSSCKSAPPWCAASNAFHKPSYRDRRARPSDGRCGCTVTSRCAAGHAGDLGRGTAGSQAGHWLTVVDRCPGLLGSLGLDRPAGFLLDHGGAVPYLTPDAYVVDPEPHKVAAAQLAVDREVE